MASHQFYPNQAKGLEGLNRQLNAFYRVNPHLAAVTPLVHGQIVATKPGYPFLKAKAAQCRHLAEFAVILAAKHAFGAPASDGQPARVPFCFPANHRLHGREREHLDLLFAMAQSMAAYSRAVSAPQFDANACSQSMLSFLQALSGLHALWREGLPAGSRLRRTAPFVVRKKAHMLMHLVLNHIPMFGTPAACWCYRDEYFCGSVKSICARTKHPSTLEDRVCIKLRVLESLGIRM